MAVWVCSASSRVGEMIEGAQLTARPFEQVLEDGQDKYSRLPGTRLGQA